MKGFTIRAHLPQTEVFTANAKDPVSFEFPAVSISAVRCELKFWIRTETICF